MERVVLGHPRAADRVLTYRCNRHCKTEKEVILFLHQLKLVTGKITIREKSISQYNLLTANRLLLQEIPDY